MNKNKCNSRIIIVGLTILLVLYILNENSFQKVETFKKKERRCIKDECDPKEGTHQCIYKMNAEGKLVRTCKQRN